MSLGPQITRLSLSAELFRHAQEHETANVTLSMASELAEAAEHLIAAWHAERQHQGEI